jgi:hypothetical protein
VSQLASQLQCGLIPLCLQAEARVPTLFHNLNFNYSHSACRLKLVSQLVSRLEPWLLPLCLQARCATRFTTLTATDSDLPAGWSLCPNSLYNSNRNWFRSACRLKLVSQLEPGKSVSIQVRSWFHTYDS